MLAGSFLSKIAPELAVSEQEAMQLAAAYANWRQYYGPSGVDPRYIAAFGLAATAWSVFKPKVARVASRKASEKAAVKVQQAAQQGGSYARPIGPNGMGPTVVPMPGI